MKKILLTAITVCLISLFGLGSCANAMVNDGNHIRKYTNNSATGSEGGAVPFSMYNDKMDFQKWTDWNAGCSTQIQDDALVIAQTGNWYGLAICSNASGSDSSASAAIYDLSSIAKITFEAKSDTNNSVMNFSACTEDAVSYTLGTEYKTFTYDMAKATHAKNGKHYCMVSIVQKATTEPIVHYIKNIAFWDASGTEVVPEIVD